MRMAKSAVPYQNNPHNLKAEVVAAGLKAAEAKMGKIKGDPIKAVSAQLVTP